MKKDIDNPVFLIFKSDKVLKDLLISIKECEYFSRQTAPVEEDGTSSEDAPEEEATLAVQSDQNEEPLNGNDVEQPQAIVSVYLYKLQHVNNFSVSWF